jgi:hypothetical protein
VEAITRHPAYASWLALLLMLIAIAAFSPAGDLVLPFVAGAVALVLAVVIYVVLKRQETSRPN